MPGPRYGSFYPKSSVPFRLHRIQKGLGWNGSELARVLGISRRQFGKYFELYYGYGLKVKLHPRTRVLRAILEIERIYAQTLKRFDRHPSLWNRLPEYQKSRAVSLPPYPVPRRENLSKVDVLEANRSPESKERRQYTLPSPLLAERKRNVNRRRSRTLTQTLARTRAAIRAEYAINPDPQLRRSNIALGGTEPVAKRVRITNEEEGEEG